ncbi:GGDEF domain-containing protein [Actinoplanes sp. NEAU-A12]|uniref:GGDEF domain-containing protein n=1 Tax=Actinoplanes sandaracinus TaxID=3045177 RepID=A0ABT6WKT1_9ACTN|nr:GGDEF domain-containing protein [Actinoplanes sandaracinus]MDI6100343.1 GGDEF domain-containing protein [Actinoplanes sandaracinus]
MTASPPNEPTIRDRLVAYLEELELSTPSNFEAVSAPAATVELQARNHGFDDLAQRAQLILADVAGRRGDVAELGRVARAVTMWAEQHGDDVLLARGNRLLAVFFRRIGDNAQSLAHAVTGLQHSHSLPEPLRGSQLITLALVLDLNGQYQEASRRFGEALQIAEKHDDAYQALTIINNMAFTAFENEDVDTANDLARQMRTLAADRGITLDGLHLDTLARIALMQGHFDEAEAALQPVLDDPNGPLVSEGDSLPECLLTLVEIYERTGRADLAGETLDRASAICDQRGLAGVAARVHHARAEWYAAAGRYREAYDEYRVFHARSEALHSAEREARAYTMQAVFEAAEARRSSERFQALAYQDALTGLHNRRYIDERLTAAVAAAGRDGEPLSVAVIDADHFKRINDVLSHAAGDAVLQELGALLKRFTTGSECAARLGGEEFLLLLPGAGATAALHRCEALADLVRSTDWSALAGAIPVTVSIGVATYTGGPVSPESLLAHADERLYAAKHAGRDRVMGARRPAETVLP